jgi:hypothetical protein
MRKLQSITLGFARSRYSETDRAIKLAQSQGGQTVKRYKLNTIIIALPDKGFLIQTPTGKTLFDSRPRSIVRELNRLNDRIKQLEIENDSMRADLLLWNEKEVKL